MADPAGGDTSGDAYFIRPQQFLTTALGITVGVAWNNAVREVVDDVVGTDTGFGALVYAVLVTLIVLLIFYTVNLTHWFHTGGEEKGSGAGARG